MTSVYACLLGSMVFSCNNSWMMYENSFGSDLRTFERVYLEETFWQTVTNWFKVVRYQLSKSASAAFTKCNFCSG